MRNRIGIVDASCEKAQRSTRKKDLGKTHDCPQAKNHCGVPRLSLEDSYRKVRLIILVESRIRRNVYVRFGGEYLETDHSNMIRRWILSLLQEVKKVYDQGKQYYDGAPV